MRPDETVDPNVDIDPQDAIDADYDEAGDIEDPEGADRPDLDGDAEHVEGAEPVDETLADEEIPVDDAFEADEDDEEDDQ